MTQPDWPCLRGHTILQVIPDLAAGGAERTTIEMAEAVHQAGGRALVVSEGGRLEGRLTAAGGELIRLPVAGKSPTTLIRNAARLAKLIRSEKVSLVHARSRAPAWSALWACKLSRVPFVTTYHGAYSGKTRIKRFYNSIMARGTRVIANSNWTADHVMATHGTSAERIVTIPRGVDFSIFDPDNINGARLTALARNWNIADEDERMIILLAGRLTSWKGQLLAVNAMAQLSRDEQEGLHLVLAGDAQGRTDYLRQIENSIMNQGLAGAVSIVGHCEDMAAAYRLSDIVIAPSQRPEAFGRVAAEASAMGRPVIVSDHGGQRETVLEGETGARAEPGNFESLAACLRMLVNLPPEAREAMGRTGQTFVRERFSRAQLQRATLAVYQDVLNTNSLVES